MKTLIFSDVHGNLPAFEAMLETEKDCDKYICLGDLVNYAPWSNECVDLALSLPNIVLIMGNHEQAFIEGQYPGQNELVKQFFSKTIADFKKQNEISLFINDYVLDNYSCQHTILDQYIYPDTSVSLDNHYIIGHSHHQFRYQNKDFVLYNAGSVGQNRLYINVINYLIYDTTTKDITMKSQTYDVNIVLTEMKTRNYPPVCIDYYAQKKRLN
jgi:predicted phosphodiesterase